MILFSRITESGPKLAVKLPTGTLILTAAKSRLGDSTALPETLDEAFARPRDHARSREDEGEAICGFFDR